MDDHTETLEIDFNPDLITVEEILDLFWDNHNPNMIPYKGRQYISILLYHNDRQKEIIHQKKKQWEERFGADIHTEIQPFSAFHIAEAYHQKYYLKRFSKAIEILKNVYPTETELVNSTLVARLNGLAGGYGLLAEIKKQIENQWGLEEEESRQHSKLLQSIKW